MSFTGFLHFPPILCVAVHVCDVRACLCASLVSNNAELTISNNCVHVSRDGNAPKSHSDSGHNPVRGCCMPPPRKTSKRYDPLHAHPIPIPITLATSPAR